MESTFFISVDWGTTNLRIRLIDLNSNRIINSVASENGVKKVYFDWCNTDKNRSTYFLEVLRIEILKLNIALPGDIPVVISGMASSSIGIKELPYAQTPFNLDGSSLYAEKIQDHIYLISGVKTDSDVIRGEEVQLLGLSSLNLKNKPNLFILPGTHSKHMICSNGELIDFKTYMTGELFETISKNTILKDTVDKGIYNEKAMEAFSKGLKDTESSNSILNNLFKVRTNTLFNQLSENENYYYLSGLLIGEELKELKTYSENTIIHLCASGNLFDLYNTALQHLKLNQNISLIGKDLFDNTIITAHINFLKKKL